jgi:hypothetical protein
MSKKYFDAFACIGFMPNPKMWVPFHIHGVPWLPFVTRWPYMSNEKVQAIIDWPEPWKVKGYPIPPWICKFLLSIHL